MKQFCFNQFFFKKQTNNIFLIQENVSNLFFFIYIKLHINSFKIQSSASSLNSDGEVKLHEHIINVESVRHQPTNVRKGTF